MFGVSFPELFVVFIVALLAFGPERLPELARKLGKISAELKKNTDALRREFYNTVYLPGPDVSTRQPRPLKGSQSSPPQPPPAESPNPSTKEPQ